jgi:hypothetical protein
MNRFIDRCGVIQHETGAHVLAVHHTGKDESKGARGSTALTGALDCSFLVTKDCIKCAKLKEEQITSEMYHLLHQVHLGKDAEGDLMTSCVVMPTNGPSDFSTEVAIHPIAENSHARICFDALKVALATAPMAPPVEFGLDDGEKITSVKVWRKQFNRIIGREVSNPRRSFRDAVEELTKRDKIRKTEDFAWLP